MKKLLATVLFAGGISLAASAAATAAPVGNQSFGTALNLQGLIQQAQYGGGYDGGYGGGYGGGGGYRQACHYVRRCSGHYPYQRCWRERVCH